MVPCGWFFMAEDRRSKLEAVLYVLEESLLEAPAYSRAAIAREIRATLAELASLPEVKADPLDDLAGRRARRRSDAAVSG